MTTLSVDTSSTAAKVTVHLHLLTRLRMSGVTTLLSHTPLRRVEYRYYFYIVAGCDIHNRNNLLMKFQNIWF